VSSSLFSPLPSRPATIDLARARPTERVVLGSLVGGFGAGKRPVFPPGPLKRRGNVAHCRGPKEACSGAAG
jgi:hypothetical protein